METKFVRCKDMIFNTSEIKIIKREASDIAVLCDNGQTHKIHYDTIEEAVDEFIRISRHIC